MVWSDDQLYAVGGGVEEDRKRRYDQYVIAQGAFNRRYSEADAINAANFARAYLNGTPDIVAAVAEARIPWDTPALGKIMAQDAVEQDGVMDKILRPLKATTRTAAALADSWWDEGLGRITRTGILAYQGEGDNLVENWMRAGSSYAGQAARDVAQGRPIELGEGWLPSPTPVHEREGFSDAFGQNLAQLNPEDPLAIPQAYQETEDQFLAQYGPSTVQRAWDEQQTTIISSTRNGQTYSTPFSFGRAAAVRVATPGTVPFNVLSGSIDAYTRVAWDPLNVPLWQVGRYIKARRLYQPIDEVLEVVDDVPAGEPVAVTGPSAKPQMTRLRPVEKSPSMGQTWNVGDDAVRLREIIDELDDLQEVRFGPPNDFELMSVSNGELYQQVSTTGIDAETQIARLLTEKDALMGKLATAGIYTEGGNITPGFLDDLVEATKGVEFAEFVDDVPAKGPYARPEDVGPGLDGMVFHGGPDIYDPSRPFRGGVSLRADRAAGYAWDASEQGGKGYVYVYNIDELDDVAKAHLRDVGDIEQAMPPINIPEGMGADVFDQLRRRHWDLMMQDELAERSINTNFGGVSDSPEASGILDELNRGWDDFSTTLDEAGITIEDLEDLGHEAIRTQMPKPVAVYPVEDFTNALHEGRLQLPGPDAHVTVPDVPTGRPVVPNLPPSNVPPPRIELGPTKSSVGIIDSWRPFADPVTALHHFTKGKGQRIVKFLVQADMDEVASVLGDLPAQAMLRIADATDEATVIDELMRHLGAEISAKPRIPSAFDRPVLGSTFYGDGTAASIATRVAESPPGRLYRMLGATTNGVVLDPQDASRSIVETENYLRGFGIDADVINPILRNIAQSEGSTPRMLDAYGGIMDAIRDRLKTKSVLGVGYDDYDVAHIMDTIMESQRDAMLYTVDNLGNPVLPPGSKTYRHTTQTGKEIEIALDGAALDSEFRHTTIYLPSAKEMRRTLSSMRIVTDEIRDAAAKMVYAGKAKEIPGSDLVKHWHGEPLGLNRSRAQIALDYYLGGWRNLALLRVGWMLRYLPDEAARFVASGELNSNASYFMWAMNHGHLNLLGDNLDDVLRAQGLGAAHFIHHFDDTIAGAPFDAGRVSWATASRGTQGYARGLAREAVQVNKSILAQVVMDRGVDDAFDFFRTSTQGRQILDEIVDQAASGSRLQQMGARTARGDDVLRDVLREAEWRTARVAGSDQILYRNQDTGRWLDAYGQEVATYDELTKAQLLEEAKRRNIPGRSRMNKEDLRRGLITDDGNELILDAPDSQGFITLDPGSPRARQFLRDGLDDHGAAIIGDNMTDRQWHQIEGIYGDYISTAGYETPLTVKVPSTVHADRTAKFGDRFTDIAFRFLGQAPTTALIRSPYAKAAYADELARIYLFGNQASRGRLLKWADEIGIADDFDDMIRKHLKDRRMTSLPKGELNISNSHADQIARSIAVEGSRELFYDLAKTHNWADMSRIIFPFADAWWEVISRWAGLLNPTRDTGRALMNWRRAEQGVMGARQSGWFTEDNFGNETFNWFPAIGTLGGLVSLDSGSEGVQIENRMSLERLLFVDPSDPGQASHPGFSPFAQVAAALVEPLVPTQFQDEYRKAIFGDFRPPDIPGEDIVGSVGEVARVHAPTWLRRVFEGWGDANRTDQAGVTVRIYESLVLSGDPRFQIGSPDDAQRVMEHARAISGRINLARIFDGFLGPAQQYEPEFYTWAQGTDDPGFWMNTYAVGEEMRYLEELLGSREAAISSIHERFGFNPLDTGAGTAFIRDFPTGKDGFQYLQEHPELNELFPNTMMMFIPEDDDVEFYRPAWDAAKEFGARIEVTAEIGPSLRSASKGNHLYAQLQAERDQYLETIAGRFPPDSARYGAYRRQINEWFELETLQLGTEFGPYWAWGFDQNIKGVSKPTTRMMLEEISRAGGYDLVVNADGSGVSVTERDTEAGRYAQVVNPELHGFIQYAMRRWKEADSEARRQSFAPDWWHTSEAQNDPRPQMIRDWYLEGLRRYTAGMETARGRAGANYFAERIITPLFAGADFDDPIILFEEPPAPPAR